MRVLFLTNLYPPLSSGGFEQWCEEVAGGLAARGHAVTVLTTRPFRPLDQPDPTWVHRDLHMEMEFGTNAHSLHFFTQRQAHEQHNLECLRQRIELDQPEALVIWGMWNLPRSLAALAEALLPGRVVYYMGDYWPTLPNQHRFYWDAPAKNGLNRVVKGLLKPLASYMLAQEEQPALRFERVLFPSRFMQAEFERLGVPVGESRVIAGAIDTRPYAAQAQPEIVPHRMDLLYAGRLAPEKGLETALEAMRTLAQEQDDCQVSLTIVGGGESQYRQRLHEIVRQAGLGELVSFQPPVTKAEMPALYRQFDAYLFTSIWDEPFGRVLVEAMAAGISVIGSATGGAAEILVDGENGLTFPPGDSQALAGVIRRLCTSPALRLRLIENGRRAAREKFDITRMAAEIEDYLVGFVLPVEVHA